MSSSKQYTTKLLERTWLTNDVLFVRLQLNGDMPYKAGQFVMLNIEGEKRPRAFSIANTPNDLNVIELLIKKYDASITAPYLDSLQISQEVSLRGPFGQFIFKETERTPFFVATGVGVAPILGLLCECDKAELIFGVRNEEDILYQETLEKLAPGYTLTLSQPSEGWEGTKGRVTEYLPTDNAEIYDYYICGSTEMVKDTKKILEDRGVPIEQINFEIF